MAKSHKQKKVAKSNKGNQKKTAKQQKANSEVIKRFEESKTPKRKK
jgi:hypothetical protein